MWLDLKMKGIDPENIRPMEKSLLMSHAARKRDQRYAEMMLLVRAVMAGASIAVGDQSGLDKLKDMHQYYTDLVYPEDAHDLEDKAERTKRILEREFAKGPMKVQAQDYDRKRKRRRR